MEIGSLIFRSQAIIDSCTRQFPEYSERARKRIRTYLKSCRRFGYADADDVLFNTDKMTVKCAEDKCLWMIWMKGGDVR